MGDYRAQPPLESSCNFRKIISPASVPIVAIYVENLTLAIAQLGV